jgi:hypothetical protein
MTLREASTRFLKHIKAKNSHDAAEAQAQARTIEFLTAYLPEAALTQLTPARLRDFIARWYVEQTNHQPEPQALLDSLAGFLSWVDANTDSMLEAGCRAIIGELKASLPRALEISDILSSQLRSRGAFGFPEFLTSFEEGGRSQYDVDVGGNVAALEGFFRISRVEGTSVEAEELISEERVWPVSVPPEVAALLEVGYIVNLELVRAGGGWQIAACGFAYPPGTAF